MKTFSLAIPALALAMLGTAAAAGAQQGYPQQPQQGYPPQQQQGYPPQQQPGYPPQQQPGYQPGQPGYGGQGGWEAPPQEMREFARQGFRDGIQGARRDMENHRRPNVNNRDEFRHPQVPRNVRGDYRMGFRRGYDMAIQRAAGGYRQNGYGPPQRPY